MELPVQITLHDFQLSAAAEQEIRTRAAKLTVHATNDFCADAA